MKTFDFNKMAFWGKIAFIGSVATLFTLIMFFTRYYTGQENIKIAAINFLIFSCVGFAIYDSFKQLLSYNKKKGIILYALGILFSYILYIIDGDVKPTQVSNAIMESIYYSLVGGTLIYLLAKGFSFLKNKFLS